MKTKLTAGRLLGRTAPPRLLATLIASALCLGVPEAMAAFALPNWGTETNAGIADVHTGGGQDNFTGDFGAGGAGVAADHAVVNDAITPDSFGNGPQDRGLAESSAALQAAPNQMPLLRSRSTLTGNTSGRPDINDAAADSMAFASELFQYNGAGGNLTLNIDLHGLLSNLPFNNQTAIRADIALFDPNGYFFFSDLGTLIYEGGATPLTKVNNGGGQALSQLAITADTSGAFTNVLDSLTVNLATGDQFYLFAKLTTSAFRGTRAADAFSTLGVQFDQPGLVQPLSTVVPEPTSLSLIVGVALLGLACRRRLSA